MKLHMFMGALLATASCLYAADQVEGKEGEKAEAAKKAAVVKALKPAGKKSRGKKVTILTEKPATEANRPAKEARKKGEIADQKESSATQDENGVQKKKIESEWSMITCLDPRLPEGEASLKDMLKTRRNCLNGFMNRYDTELMQLKDKGLFAGEVTEYNKEVMEILVRIFQREEGGKSTENIVLDFIRYPSSFRQDLRALWELIKENDHHEEDTEINRLWKEMSDPCAMLVWCINYRGRHLNTYLKETGK